MSLRTNGNAATGVTETAIVPTQDCSGCFFLKVIAATTNPPVFTDITDNVSAIGQPANYFQAVVTNAGQTNFQLSDPLNDVVGATIILGAWYFIAYSYVHAGHVAFYNQLLGGGMQVFSGSAQNAANATTDIGIGIQAPHDQSGQPSNACIAGVRFWNGVALSQEAFQRESQSIRAYRRANLTLEWPLVNDLDLTDQVQGTVLTGTAAQLAPGEWPPGVEYLAVSAPQTLFVPSSLADTNLPAKRAPGFPRNAPFPGIPLLGRGILQPSVASAVQLLDNWLPSYPDNVTRLALSLASQFYATELAPKPEAPGPSAPPEYPDTVAYPRLPLADQLAYTEEEARPERTSPLAATSYPDTIARPALPVVDQLAASEEEAIPERTAVLAAIHYPDTVARPTLPVTSHLFATGLPPAPERSATQGMATYPDTVARAVMPPSAWVEAGAPERNAPLWSTTYPDNVARPALPLPDHLPATEEEARPERTAVLADTRYPDTVARPALPAWQHLFATGLSPFPLPNLAAPLGVGALWPDTVARPALAVVSHAYEALGPSPIATPFGWPGEWPDTVARPALAAASQQAIAEPPKTDRTSPIADAEYPWAVARPALATAAQLAATELPPLPITALVLPVQPSFPDTVARPALPVAAHFAATAETAQPERTAPLASPTYPDTAQLARLQPPLHFAWHAEPTAPERTQVAAAAVYPDTVARPLLPARAHLYATGLPPLPIPNVVTFESFSVYPDSVPAPSRFALTATWSHGFLELVVSQVGKLVGRTMSLTGFLGSTYALPPEQDQTPTGTGNMGSTNT